MNIAIMGYGTIGSGVAEVLSVNSALIEERAGCKLTLTKVLDLRDFEGDPIAPLVVHDYRQIAEDDSIDMVVETMGGVEPAFTFVRAMLESGKHVASSNKALVAEKGAELLEIARANRVQFLFEASVGGGIPIIRTLLSCLTGDRIDEITGIINGTTNYMLTKMASGGSGFDEVLKEAQTNGFAEADPSADIEGHDATRKIAILTSLIAGTQVDYRDIPVEGITEVSTEDFVYADKLLRTIKLLATCKREADTFSIRVAPFLLDDDHPLFVVHGVMNAVYVVGNMLGESMYYGSGAGSLPTASAVVGDLVAMARTSDRASDINWSHERIHLADPGDHIYRNFVRLSLPESEIKNYFIAESVIDAGIEGEVGIVTSAMTEREYDAAVSKLPEGTLLGRIRLA